MTTTPKTKKTKEPTQRQLRVGEEIRHILADVFMRADFHDPALRGISITVSEVEVAADMRNATAYIAPLAGKGNPKKIIAALNENPHEFNQAVAKKMTMKYTPRVKFSLDTRFDYAEKIEALIKKTQE